MGVGGIFVPLTQICCVHVHQYIRWKLGKSGSELFTKATGQVLASFTGGNIQWLDNHSLSSNILYLILVMLFPLIVNSLKFLVCHMTYLLLNRVVTLWSSSSHIITMTTWNWTSTALPYSTINRLFQCFFLENCT